MTTITALPDGRFNLSTKPTYALSEGELRYELTAQGNDPWIVEDLIRLAKQR